MHTPCFRNIRGLLLAIGHVSCDGDESNLTAVGVVGLVARTTALCSVYCTEATGASPTMLRPAPSGRRLHPTASAARSTVWTQPVRTRNNGAAAVFEEVARGDAE